MGVGVCWPWVLLSCGLSRQGVLPHKDHRLWPGAQSLGAQPGPRCSGWPLFTHHVSVAPAGEAELQLIRNWHFPALVGVLTRLFQVLCLLLCFALPSLLQKSPLCERKKRERERESMAKIFLSKTFTFVSAVSVSKGRKKVTWDKPKWFAS